MFNLTKENKSGVTLSVWEIGYVLWFIPFLELVIVYRLYRLNTVAFQFMKYYIIIGSGQQALRVKCGLFTTHLASM